ncbi:hypothetical protein BKA63DRAFT_118005 [Paraphoma chrysanthemicola]|nr:hypothetical protein BKA63DRAFT_118005 [Paraphoma chrysanthemicola]
MRKGRDGVATLVILGHCILGRTPVVAVLPSCAKLWGRRETYCVDIKSPQEHGCKLWRSLTGLWSAGHDLVVPVGFNLLSPELIDEVPLASRDRQTGRIKTLRVASFSSGESFPKPCHGVLDGMSQHTRPCCGQVSSATRELGPLRLALNETTWFLVAHDTTILRLFRHSL